MVDSTLGKEAAFPEACCKMRPGFGWGSDQQVSVHYTVALSSSIWHLVKRVFLI